VNNLNWSKVLVFVFVFAGAFVAACTRSASTPKPNETSESELSEALQQNKNLRAQLAKATEVFNAEVDARVAEILEAKPTPTNVPIPTSIPPTETSREQPVYVDVPWFFQDPVRKAVDNGWLNPVSDTVLSDESNEIVRAWQIYVPVRKILYPDEPLPIPTWKFRDLSISHTETVLDEEIVRFAAPYIEDLWARGDIDPCNPRNDPPGVCPAVLARGNTARILIDALGVDVPAKVEFKDIPEDVSVNSLYAPFIKVFIDLGFPQPGTSPDEYFHPSTYTTMLQAAVWLDHFDQLVHSGE